jgi:hypothetical protein
VKSTETLSIRPGDVFAFKYHMRPGDTYTDRYWCFDGQLVADMHNGEIILVDTYWGDSGSNRRFTQEEAKAQGTLTLVCNMDEVEPIKDGVYYYDEKDVFDLSHQHGCYKRLMKRKGAPRSRDAMLAHLRGKMQEAKRKVELAVHDVEFLAVNIHVVQEADDLEKVWV